MKLAYFSGIYVAVFNCKKRDIAQGRKAVIEALGVDAWKRVRNTIKTGVMELFEHPETPAVRLFAETVAQSADDRVSKYLRIKTK